MTRPNEFGSGSAGSAATELADLPTAHSSATPHRPAARRSAGAPPSPAPGPPPRPEVDPDRHAIDGVVVARLLALRSDGKAMVEVLDPSGLDPRLRQPIFATSLAALAPRHIGRHVALLFERGDPGKPIIMAAMHAPPPVPADPGLAPREPVAVALDGDVLHLDARRELVLSCGKASVTLTRAGKIIMHGTYVVSRSSGVNRIKGGSVQIN